MSVDIDIVAICKPYIHCSPDSLHLFCLCLVSEHFRTLCKHSPKIKVVRKNMKEPRYRKNMMRNLTTQIIRSGRIKTTRAKAEACRIVLANYIHFNAGPEVFLMLFVHFRQRGFNTKLHLTTGPKFRSSWNAWHKSLHTLFASTDGFSSPVIHVA